MADTVGRQFANMVTRRALSNRFLPGTRCRLMALDKNHGRRH